MSFTPPSPTVDIPTLRPVPFHRTPISRPIDVNWQCQKDGACCKEPSEVVMTLEERLVFLRALPDGVKTEWRALEDTHFVALKAHPCPAYIFNECTVYASRPYNCRRYNCLRPDPKSEPWDGYNMQDRIAVSRPMYRLMKLLQRKAQRWAFKHGWPMTDEA